MGIFSKALPEVISYVEALDVSLRSLPGGKKLSRVQKVWLSFCLTAIVVTHTLCWEKFERSSAGSYKARALSFMFHHSNILWNKIFTASTLLLLRLHNAKSGILSIDDSNRGRSKSTTRIFGVHKVKDKKTNGFEMAQNLVRLILVTPSITIPVGIEFYRPDPEYKKWRKQDEILRKQKIPKSQRPSKPLPNKEYPTKHEIAAKLLRDFKKSASHITIHSIMADAAYLSPAFAAACADIYPGTQFISQLRCTQLVWNKNKKKKTLDDYFAHIPATRVKLLRRGSDPVMILMASARLCVNAHCGKKMQIVAMKYGADEKYRYLSAIDLTWRSLDIVKAYAFRWFSEVEIEDWKLYEGWGKAACQQDEKGARRGVCLSLLVDHFLLHHPEQLRLSRKNQPLYTVGTLMNKLQFDCLLAQIRSILEQPDPKEALNKFADQLQKVVVLRNSDKHMSGKEFPELGPSPALARCFKNAA
jgi:hypothetical protein